MKNLLILAAVLLALPGDLPGQGVFKAKKVLEWGWDEPDTTFIRRHIADMERLPFDGLIFHMNSSTKGNLSWEAWGPRRFTQAEFRKAVEDLKATPFRGFRDRFLRMNVTPGKTDWFDDAEWDVVRRNFAVAAQLARQTGCKGFMFDVEQYEGQLFNYAKQKHTADRSFAVYRKQVRQRGREWIRAINGPFPDITILLTFGYSIARPATPGADRSTAGYGLLADFLDGVLDACTPGTVLVDAWESSYGYKHAAQFTRAYQTIKKHALDWTANPARYREHIRAGFGIWLDNNWRRKGWNTSDFTRNYFTPPEFEMAVRSALQASDKYVWIYTEQPRWWNQEKLPKAYIDALARARKDASAK